MCAHADKADRDVTEGAVQPSAYGRFRGKKAATVEAMQIGGGDAGDLEGEATSASLVLMPPTLQRRVCWLVVGLYAAEGLPAMDDDMFGGMAKAGIDAFVEVHFAANPVARTNWVTKKGAGNLSVEWHRELSLKTLHLHPW
ncbi:hypothetical protein EON62_01405 [archaeon]|nr:MAG: hypothetical protein EON62_01405 [archaeon]